MMRNYLYNRNRPTSAQKVRVCALLLTATLAVGLTTGFASTRTTYVIRDGDDITTVEGYAGQLDGALLRAGLVLSPADRVSTRPADGVVAVDVSRSQTVSLRDGESFTTVTAYGETAGQLLRRLNITLNQYDKLDCDLARPVTDGLALQLHRADVAHGTERQAIPFETVRRENPSLYQGQERVVQAGAAGAENRTYRLVTVAGETEKTLTGVTTALQPVAQITEYGTKSRPNLSALSASADFLTGVKTNSSGGGVITTVSGQTLSYSRALNVKATAYTTERQSWKRTATGTTARVGAIAVDPSVIPYGTRMFIQSADGSIVYGVATAEDCGSGVKGNRVDLFFNTYDTCINFGVRNCVVYILN